MTDDAELERIIDASAGEWHDDEFRITGSDLMHMLRAVSRLRGDAGQVAELREDLAKANAIIEAHKIRPRGKSVVAAILDLEAQINYLESQLAEIAAALPGNYYMDPPDGGNVSIAEQVRRMAADVAISVRNCDPLESDAAKVKKFLAARRMIDAQNVPTDGRKSWPTDRGD